VKTSDGAINKCNYEFCVKVVDKCNIQSKPRRESIIYSSVINSMAQSLKLRVFENKVRGRIFGPKVDEVAGDWTKLHNEGLHNLYFSPMLLE
jgi:hypothetical protein